MSKRVKPWRAAVKEAALEVMKCYEGFPIETAVTLEVAFAFLRPKSHRKANGDLKPNAPPRHVNSPDLDKLVRSTSDALTEAGLIRDDRLIVRLLASKHYGSFSGARVAIVTEVDRDPLTVLDDWLSRP